MTGKRVTIEFANEDVAEGFRQDVATDGEVILAVCDDGRTVITGHAHIVEDPPEIFTEILGALTKLNSILEIPKPTIEFKEGPLDPEIVEAIGIKLDRIHGAEPEEPITLLLRFRKPEDRIAFAESLARHGEIFVDAGDSGVEKAVPAEVVWERNVES